MDESNAGKAKIDINSQSQADCSRTELELLLSKGTQGVLYTSLLAKLGSNGSRSENKGLSEAQIDIFSTKEAPQYKDFVKAISDEETWAKARGYKASGDKDQLIDYIQSVRQRNPKLASDIYDSLYPKEGRQDTELAGVETPKFEKARDLKMNELPGGKAKDKKPSDFDPKSLKAGIAVESEHTTDPKKAEEIAMDHLAEDPDYYKDWKAKEKILFQPKVAKSANLMLKAKVVTRDGKQYYAEGPNAGKEVGTVRGAGTKESPADSSPTAAKPAKEQAAKPIEEQDPMARDFRAKASEVLDNLKNQDFVKNRTTDSGKGMAYNLTAARQIGYTVADYNEAAAYHLDQANRVGAFIQEHKLQFPELVRLKEKHQQLGLVFNAERVRVEERKKNAMKKSQAELAHLDARSLDSGSYAKEREEHLKSGWLEKLYKLMEGFTYGDLPREIDLDKGRLYLVKVDEGMYTGYIKLMDLVENSQTGELQTMQDTAKFRLERMTLPEIPSFLMAKEYINPIQAPQLPVPVDSDYTDARFEEMSEAITDLQENIPVGNPVLEQKIRILELIAKLMA